MYFYFFFSFDFSLRIFAIGDRPRLVDVEGSLSDFIYRYNGSRFMFFVNLYVTRAWGGGKLV